MLKSLPKQVKMGSMYFVGNIFDKAVAFITIPIFTRLLSTTDYGIVSTYVSWVGILAIITGLSLGNSVRTAVVDYRNNIYDYISSVTFLGLICGIIFLALSLFLGNYITFGVERNLLTLCVLQAMMMNIGTTFSMKLMMDESYVKRTLLTSLPNLVTAILSILFIISMDSDKYMGRIYAYVLVTTIVGVSLLYYIFSHGRRLYDADFWKYGLSFSIPIIFHSLSVIILAQSDRIMITSIINPSETGIYSLIYNFSLSILAVSITVENVWIPWFTRKMENQDRATVNLMSGPYVEMVSLVSVVVMFIAPEVLSLLAPPSYASGFVMVQPIVLATVVMFFTSLFIDLEYYKKKTKHIAKNTMVAAAVNIILNLLFIPKYGAIAAAYTTLAAYFVSFIMHYIYSHRIEPKLFSISIFIKPSLWLIIGGGLSVLLIPNIAIRYLIALCVASYGLYHFRQFYKAVKQS